MKLLIPVLTTLVMGLLIYSPVSTIDIKFDLIDILNRNGLSSLANKYRQPLVKLGSDMVQFFDRLATKPNTVDDLDYAIRYDVGNLVDNLYNCVIIFEKNLAKDINRQFTGRLATVGQLLAKLRDAIHQVFDPRVKDVHKRPDIRQQAIDNSLDTDLYGLAQVLSQSLTEELEPQFSRSLAEFYNEIGQAYDEAVGSKLKTMLLPPGHRGVGGGGGGQVVSPEKYRYLIDFDRQWDQLMDQIKQTFKN
ncbi:uncharacterized protein LOC128953132 [Oppia nitens]|uniref:uncharacterized protein LOC128953132 n=1 Tax=Oppia nitens TaxID=1686743 RepID=UPI0023D9C462|nr:uncharacterized protein LOC128953132 [Oppia nitens]